VAENRKSFVIIADRMWQISGLIIVLLSPPPPIPLPFLFHNTLLSSAGFVRQKRGKKMPLFIKQKVTSSSPLLNPAQGS
jgi:hypothetical protein